MRFVGSMAACVAVIALALSPTRGARAEPDAPAAPVVLDLGGESLRVANPDLAGLSRGAETDDQLKAWWTGTVDASEVLVEVRVFDDRDGRYGNPKSMSSWTSSM